MDTVKVFVDQKNFEAYRPRTFEELVFNFTKYKASFGN